MQRLGALRESLSQPPWRQRSRDFLEGLNIPLGEFIIDRFRLRGVAPGAQHIAAATPAFYAHRDTWYANPQAQINVWMPLHEVTPENSFGFYPEWFARPADNDSARFDYAEFVAGGGFQNTAQTVHPRWLGENPAPTRAITMPAGQLLLFAAAHLHRTLPNLTDQTRFSIDLRLVHRGDHQQGVGAPNVDNGSRGDAMSDYNW